MESFVEDINNIKKSLKVIVPKKDVIDLNEKVFEKYKSRIEIDGFRKGKVPRSIIEKRFGDSLQAELADELLNKYFKDSISENKLSPVSPGKIQKFTFNDDGSFQFTAEVEVEPQIEVSKYTGLKVDKEINEVTVKDVDETIEMLREQRAELKILERGAESGSIINGDIQIIDSSGVPVIGEKYEDTGIEIGKPPLGDICEDQLIGLKAGDERRLEISQPEKDKKMQNTTEKSFFLLSVKSVLEKQLPDIDDDFASSVGKFKNIAELTEEIRNKLIAKRDEESKKVLHYEIKDKIIKKNDFELPPSMIEHSLDLLWEDHKIQNNSTENIDEEEFKKKNRVFLIWNLKWNIILKKIAELENITVSEKDVDNKINKLIEISSENEKKINAYYNNPKNRNRLKDSIFEDKILDFLVENSKIKEVKISDSKKKGSPIITV